LFSPVTFVPDALGDGRCVRALGIAEDFSREALAIEVGRPIRGSRVVRVLVPWAYPACVALHVIQTGKPMQNAFVESFNGQFRDECRNASGFVRLADACRATASGRIDFDEVRPHGSLGNPTPDEYAQQAARPENLSLRMALRWESDHMEVDGFRERTGLHQADEERVAA